MEVPCLEPALPQNSIPPQIQYIPGENGQMMACVVLMSPVPGTGPLPALSQVPNVQPMVPVQQALDDSSQRISAEPPSQLPHSLMQSQQHQLLQQLRDPLPYPDQQMRGLRQRPSQAQQPQMHPPQHSMLPPQHQQHHPQLSHQHLQQHQMQPQQPSQFGPNDVPPQQWLNQASQRAQAAQFFQQSIRGWEGTIGSDVGQPQFRSPPRQERHQRQDRRGLGAGTGQRRQLQARQPSMTSKELLASTGEAPFAEQMMPHPQDSAEKQPGARAGGKSRRGNRRGNRAGEGVSTWGPHGGSKQVEMESMRSHLQALQLEDPATVFITRRINKLGFSSADILRAHFSRYGQVKNILVSHSRVKSQPHRRSSDVDWRLRAAALGFVVMQTPEATAAILEDGSEHAINGVTVLIQRFHRWTGSNQVNDFETCNDSADGKPAGSGEMDESVPHPRSHSPSSDNSGENGGGSGSSTTAPNSDGSNKSMGDAGGATAFLREVQQAVRDQSNVHQERQQQPAMMLPDDHKAAFEQEMTQLYNNFVSTGGPVLYR